MFANGLRDGVFDALIDIEDGVREIAACLLGVPDRGRSPSITASLLLLAVQIQVAGVVSVICWSSSVLVVLWTDGGGGEVLTDGVAA